MVDCTLCVAECPVDAIFAEDDVPDDQRDFIQINASLQSVAAHHREERRST
jgi:ferredoxin